MKCGTFKRGRGSRANSGQSTASLGIPSLGSPLPGMEVSNEADEEVRDVILKMEDLNLRHRTMLFWQNVATKSLTAVIKDLGRYNFTSCVLVNFLYGKNDIGEGFAYPKKVVSFIYVFFSSTVSGLLSNAFTA